MKNYSHHNGTFYDRIRTDPVGSITDTLITNLETKKFDSASENYQHLLTAIQIRGYRGKDIRYAKAQLGKLAKDARKKAQLGKLDSKREDLRRILSKAQSYANQLPNPSRNERSNSKLEIYALERLPYNHQFFQVLLEENPYKDAQLILERLTKSNMLRRFEQNGVQPLRVMETIKFVPGERSKKLYVVHRRAENQIGAEILKPDQFFESERVKDFPHIAKGLIVYVLPADQSSNVVATEGLTKSGFRVIDDLVNEKL